MISRGSQVTPPHVSILSTGYILESEFGKLPSWFRDSGDSRIPPACPITGLTTSASTVCREGGGTRMNGFEPSTRTRSKKSAQKDGKSSEERTWARTATRLMVSILFREEHTRGLSSRVCSPAQGSLALPAPAANFACCSECKKLDCSSPTAAWPSAHFFGTCVRAFLRGLV